MLQWCINFLIKLSDGGVEIDNLLNQELAKELHIPIIRKFSKQKVQSSFIDNIWGVDLAEMQLISRFDKGICFLSCY